MDLTDPAAAGMTPHREALEGVGEVGAWIVDLGAAWAAELARARVVIEPKDSAVVYDATLDAPPALAWEYVTSPVRRPLWQAGVEQVRQEAGPAGRRGIGTVNHCMHGRDAVIEEVLDWEPYDHVTYRSLLPVPNVPKMVNTFVFTDLGDGRTRLDVRFATPRAAKDRKIAEGMLPMIDGLMRQGLAALTTILAEASAAAERPVEPELPVSRGRNASEPIAGAAR